MNHLRFFAFSVCSVFLMNCITTKNGVPPNVVYPEPANTAILIAVNDPGDESELRTLLAESGSFKLSRSPQVKIAYKIKSLGFKYHSNHSEAIAFLYSLGGGTLCILPAFYSGHNVLEAEIIDETGKTPPEKFSEKVELDVLCLLLAAPLQFSTTYRFAGKHDAGKKFLTAKLVLRLQERARRDKLIN